MIIDLKRAYFHSKASGKTFVKLPHLRNTSKCWRLPKSMYRTLPAAAEFQETFNLTLVDKINLNQGRSQTCLFHCSKTGFKLVYHGDDIAAVSDDDVLKAFHITLSGSFEAKVIYLIGPEPGDDKEGLLLNRCISYTDEGIIWEADPRHTELVISELGLRGAKGRNSPGHRLSEPDPSSAKLGPDQTAAYRPTAARLGFLAEDRWDLRFASKECLRSMQAPKITDFQKLKHIGRYLLTYPRSRESASSSLGRTRLPSSTASGTRTTRAAPLLGRAPMAASS